MNDELCLDDLVMMPERSARRLLARAPIVFSLLAPVGAFAGCGMLRVLRARPVSTACEPELGPIELVCGYEAYRPVDGLA